MTLYITRNPSHRKNASLFLHKIKHFIIIHFVNVPKYLDKLYALDNYDNTHSLVIVRRLIETFDDARREFPWVAHRSNASLFAVGLVQIA